MTMARELPDRLDEWKSRYGSADGDRLERLLEQAAKLRLYDAPSAIRLHETLLFLRAYPRSPAVARLADAILFTFADRVQALRANESDFAAFEEPEISGIAGTSLTAVFSYEVARRLAARHPRDIGIGWDRYDEIDRFGPWRCALAPLLAEDWPVEAHTPFREWVAAARGRGTSDLAWLLERLERIDPSPRRQAELYESAQLPLTLAMGNGRASRSRLRLPRRPLYCHAGPLLRRSDVVLARELEGPRLPLRRLPLREARRVLGLILDTSAVRYRELYGFSHPDEANVYHADAGRGVDIYFFGVPPEWRLPLRAYHAGMFFKNGVPAGYVETLSLFERAEVGFNLYYTFREGESAWLYAKVLQLCRQMLGVNCFVVDPYQIGHENPEAVESGAFWFYRKLGFRPVEPAVAALVQREESRMRSTPGYRSSPAALRKLAHGYVLYEGPGAESGAWDSFHIRTLAMAAQRAGGAGAAAAGIGQALGAVPGYARWSADEKRGVREIVAAKQRGSEARYLRLMQRHARLRAVFRKLGSAV